MPPFPRHSCKNALQQQPLCQMASPPRVRRRVPAWMQERGIGLSLTIRLTVLRLPDKYCHDYLEVHNA